MSTTNTNETLQVNFPALAFAFNPIRVVVSSNLGISKAVVLEANNIKIEREPYINQDSVSFDLSAIARSLFDRHEFNVVQEYDNTLYKTLNFKIIYSGQVQQYSLNVIWGALQIGETFKQSKTLTYFKGFPFTLPLYVERPIVLSASVDNSDFNEYKTIEAGKHNLSISDLNARRKIEIKTLTENFYGIFDYTFDETFQPQRVLLPHGLSITINIEDCPNEGVYLRWINKYGEYNYYLFQKSAETINITDNDVSFDTVYFTTALTNNYHQGVRKSIGKVINKTTKLFASLIDNDTFDLLVSLIESPVVDMFVGYNQDNSSNWVAVAISGGTFARSNDNLQDFEFLLIPNKTQVQTL